MKQYHVKIIFSTPKRFKLFSWLIKKRLKTKYSHVAIGIYLKPLDFWDVYEASYGDVHIIGYEKFFKNNEIIEEYDLQLDRIEFLSGLGWLKRQLEKGYSELGAIASTFPLLRKWKIGLDGDKRFICSELAARYLEEVFRVNYNKHRKETDYIDPKLFERIIQEQLK